MNDERRDNVSKRHPQSLVWPIPALTTHDGLPLGNGLFGALVWGQGSQVCVTINRADYWDHRGGIRFGEEANYANLRRWLEAGDETNIRRVFEGRGNERLGEPRRPSRLPMGRVDLDLGKGNALATGSLMLADGTIHLVAEGPAPTEIEAVIPRGRSLLAMRITGYAAATVSACSRPADGPEVREYWRDYGFPAPVVQVDEAEGGWTQALPADPALGVAWRIVAGEDGATVLYVAAEYGETEDAARAAALDQLEWAAAQGYAALAAAEADWWRGYWAQCAAVSVPDEGAQMAYDLAMYKLAGLSMPGTPAATLQGPWVEEYRIPPWSADYHFNINVQECCWPAYGGNQLASLEPLWEMIRSWEPAMRATAHQFLGIDDGLMLNHAVDDRCTCMGGFWTGAIDHGATAWVAQLMWQQYLYTLDTDFLRDTVYPFMVGVMRVYEVMLEEAPDGGYALPVSVSPEYEGANMWAWGRNASFQLAIIHFMCRALLAAARVLDVTPAKKDLWARIDANLPMGSIAGKGETRELMLWDDQPLAHSHRHHSHLAGLYPFDVFDPWHSEADRVLVENSMNTWVRMGKGEWSGWCVPWAAILEARMHHGESAALLLDEHRRVFRRPGYTTTHDAVIPGFTVFTGRPDVMQIEATMAAGAAVVEMLLHTAAGVLYVFPAVPPAWGDVRFDGVRTEGAFLVSAERLAGEAAWVRVLSTTASHLRLASPFPGQRVRIHSNRVMKDEVVSGDVIERDTEAGLELFLTAEPC